MAGLFASLPSPEDRARWSKAAVTHELMSDHETFEAVPLDHVRTCAGYLHQLVTYLHDQWVGLDDRELGPLTDWILAGILARENVLLLGSPGVAKTEIAMRTFEALGLSQPISGGAAALAGDESGTTGTRESGTESLRDIARRMAADEKEQGELFKYFHYVLTRFTQPEELLGPIEINLLRRGKLVRVNAGFLTGAGVYAAFLDEIFKASSAILNALLTLSQERLFFNWGGMRKANLVTLIGASNELPGGFGTGHAGIGTSGEDFQSLHAFLDRFPIRIQIPSLELGAESPGETLVAKALDRAVAREAHRLAGHRESGPASPACINDVLILGWACLQQAGGIGETPFADRDLANFRLRFLRCAHNLWGPGTKQGAVPTWTLSPRKLKALYKIALCHAMVTGAEELASSGGPVSLRGRSLRVFELIGDSPGVRNELSQQSRAGS